MEKVIASADKEALVNIVRWIQKQGLKGLKGGWKEFLNSHDKKFGADLSDPSRRSVDVLIAFLQTFTQENDDGKFIEKMMRRQLDHKTVQKFSVDSPDEESPEQRLVRLTIEHPQFMQNYSFPSHDQEWMVVPLGKTSKAMKSRTMLAIDCEMVLCQDGTEEVVRVCAVDHNLEVKLDKVVNPNKAIVDYRTEITGIGANDLEGVTSSLADIQKSLKRLLKRGTILIGHSLHNDLKALRMYHPRVIETSFLFKYADFPTGRTPSLNNLCQSVLGYEVRKEGEPHNCLNDAKAAMKLVLAKLEHGFNDPISIPGKKVANTDLAKLLLHKIPVEVPCQELRNLFSSDYDVDIQVDIRVRGQCYSTFAVFKDAREVDAAFKGIKGQENKDSWGRLQKHVSLERNSGQAIDFYIRKMTADNQLNDGELSKKRPAVDGDELSKERPAVDDDDLSKKRPAFDDDQDSKRQRMCLDKCVHLKEIKKLKKELQEREEQVLNLQKILSALTRKQGL